MARIAGIDLPKNKRGVIGLTYIYGIGRSTAARILAEAGIDESIKVQDWDDDQLGKIRKVITETYKVEGEERYQQAIADLYYKYIESYSLEYLNVIKEGAPHVHPFKVETDYCVMMEQIYDYGTFDRKDIIDTWDSETIIDRIDLVDEIPEKKDGMINESIIYETNIEKIDKMIKMLTERKELLTKKRK